MKRFAVVGHPIAHSRSPEIHQHFASQWQLSMEYQRLLAPLDDFTGTVTEFFAQGGAGLNVTVPFKAEAAAWVSELDPEAERAQAVNTIVPVNGGYRGYNTDGQGLVTDLTANLGFSLAGARVLLLGAGGAAAGVLGPLLAQGPDQLILANRTVAKAETLAERFVGVQAQSFASLAGAFDLVINATSVGLNEPAAAQNLGFADLFPPERLCDALCYDMLYGPAAGFGAYAEAAGAGGVADGLGMLVEQAAAAFSLWHGRAPETGSVIAALRNSDDEASVQQETQRGAQQNARQQD